MIWAVAHVALLAWLPGALIFRAPIAGRATRASLAAEERLFWAVLVSLLLSTSIALGLSIVNQYSFSRVVWADAGVAAAVLLAFRHHLRLGPTAPAPTLTALLPAVLVGAGLWVNFLVPPAEYIMGGRDPGVYMTEGIRLAQRGGLTVTDDVVSSVPAAYRDLFFPRTPQSGYYSNRFMGYFLLDPRTGVSVGQFPHGFPVLVAFGYGVHGLSGARAIPALCGVAGLAAVYFLGARLFGRAAGFAGASLLGMSVAQLWYSRYPNAEILLQPLVFAGLLAYVRSVHDQDRFLAPVSALLFVLGAFTHLTGSMAAGLVGAAAAVDAVARGHRVRLTFWIPLILGTGAAIVYLWRFIPPYFEMPAEFIRNLGAIRLAALACAAAVALVVLRWVGSRAPDTRNRWLASGLIAVVWPLALYAYFLRAAGGTLTPHDADSLRTFTTFYLTPAGLAAAMAGFTLAVVAFLDASAFLILLAGFSVLFFYKIRIVPEHFWAARRFLAVILPGSLLLAGAAAFAAIGVAPDSFMARANAPRVRLAWRAVGLVVVLLVAQRFVQATWPLLRHVEYAGLIPHIEQLAATFGDQDLIIVESRNASDTHVLALPLAFVYDRNVLVLASPAPPKDVFRGFLAWAHQRYSRVFFVGGGGGGTEVLSRSVSVTPIRGERFQIPEYEPALNAYPRGPLLKEFDLSIYEFLPGTSTNEVFALDVGDTDDLFVRRFFAKERASNGASVRWTRDVSYVSAVGLTDTVRRVTIWMDSGGRPDNAPAPSVRVLLANRPLGRVTVDAGMHDYVFDIPADLAASVARDDAAAQLRLETSTWNPSRIAGTDNRDLGVMIDRIEIR